ncbi:MAG: insulinase family protein, partial [Nitrospinaceae bacterium]
TLAGDNRPALLAFHDKYYAASIMKLAILSNQSLEALERLARKYFEDIPDHSVTLPAVDPEFRKPLAGKFRMLKIKTIKDTRSLGMEFPTIRLIDHLDSKPASVVGSVLGYEGKGSLLSKLKAEGLALGLSAGGGFSHPNLNTFDINISLTLKGEREYPRVLELVYSYIRMLRRTGFKEYTYQEVSRMAEINFKWRELQEGMGFVSGQAALMQTYPLDEIETLPYLYKKYEPAAYRSILDTLKPENMLVVLSSQAVETDRKEKYFGTEYALAEVDGEDFERLQNAETVAGMTYPDRNEFIPDNLVVYEENPHLIQDDEIAKVWFQFDHRFKKPKAYMKLLIETPHVYDSPDNLALSKLYEAAIAEGLNEITYPIGLAGLSYSLGLEKRGMTLTVGGYSQGLPDLLKLVAGRLTDIRISPQKFDDIKDVMIRSVQNRKLGQAYGRASYFNRQVWLVKQYTEAQLLAGFQSATFEGVKDYARKLFERVFITGVVYGNWVESDAKKSVDLLIREIHARPLPEDERFKDEVAVLDPAEKLRFSKRIADNNNALYYSLQMGERTLENSARSQLVGSIVESDFYTQMRTKQQLGYVVWSFSHRLENRLFYKMIIQSAGYGPFELQTRVEAWLKSAPAIFENLSDEEFEQHRKGLIVSLEKKPDSIGEVAGNLYYFATEEKGNFDYKRQLIEVVKKIKKEDVVAAARKLFEDPQVARSIILVQSKSNSEVVPEGVLTEISQIKERTHKRAGLALATKS